MIVTIKNKQELSNFIDAIMLASKTYSNECREELEYYYNKDKMYHAPTIIDIFCIYNEICVITSGGVFYKDDSITCYPCLDEFEYKLEYMTCLWEILDTEEEPEDFLVYWPSYDDDMARYEGR